jgi:hypothetical protein
MDTARCLSLATLDERAASSRLAPTRFVRTRPTAIGRFALMIGLLASPLAAETYHADSKAGADSHSGLTPAEAWRSLERVNRQTFKPGDAIRFRAGTNYTGQFKPQGSGQLIHGKPTPIVVGK